MACFLACFGGAKEKNKLRKKRGRRSPPNNNRVNRVYRASETIPSLPKAAIEAAVDAPAADISEKQEKQETPKICKKKVTFDPNVKTYELVAVDQDVNDSVEYELESLERLKEETVEESKVKRSPDPSYRYHNCESSDDEFTDDDEDEDINDEEYEDFDIEDEEAAIIANEEESYESFFSIPVNKDKQQQEQEEEAVDSPIPTTKTSTRDRSQYVHNVLNPVENLTQWKEVKTRATPVKNQSKENISSNLELTEAKTPPKKQEISVDTSLSSWLVTSETSVKCNSNWSNLSPMSKEEQPILGALTIDDLKHASVTSSPRKSPCRNFDDVPIVGSVGSYWNSKAESCSEVKGIPNSTSKYREDKRVNWHSSPFEVRLERALNKGSAS